MTVKDLIKQLLDYNQDAVISSLVSNQKHPFSISFGSSDGCKKETCEAVYIELDDFNQNESAG